MPAVERVRFVNAGTEATMAAVRVARAATKRNVLLKFAGCYHGHADGFLVKAGSGVATLGLPDSPGVPAALAELSVTVPFNDTAAVQDLFRLRGDDVAAGTAWAEFVKAALNASAPCVREMPDDHG